MKKLFTKAVFFLSIMMLGNLTLNAQTVAVAPPGSGTGADPWDVSTLGHLLYLQENGDMWADTIILSADIDATETRYWDGGLGWDPVGRNGSSPYQNGIFDGQGHVIRNLYINRPDKDYIGFIGRSKNTAGATVMNLGIENCEIYGDERVGAIIGDTDGKIVNCYSSGRIIASGNAGGIVGYMNGAGSAVNCYSSVTISASYRRVGGFSGGYNPDSLYNSYSCGQVSGTTDAIGGFHGRNDASNATNFKSCYWDMERSGQATSNGTVEVGLTTANMMKQASFVDWDFTSVWGIVEDVTNPFLKWQKTVIRNNYPIITPTSASLDVGYVYNNTSGAETIVEYGYIYALDSLPWISGGVLSHGTKISEVTGTSLAGGTGAAIAGAALPTLNTGEVLYAITYAIDNSGTVSYGDVVMVRAAILTEGSGTAEDPFILRTLEQLNAMNVDASLKDKHFKLGNNIDAAETTTWDGGSGWTPITGFAGTFDGDGYVIQNLFFDRGSKDYVGLFNRINSGTAVIKNLGIVDCDIHGDSYVGALCGRVDDNTGIENCYSSGIVKATNDAGGLFGRVAGGSTVTDCFSTAAVYGSKSTDTRVGGFVGTNFGPSYTDDARIYNSYSTGFAYGAVRIGGFIGRNLNGSTFNCYSSAGSYGEEQNGAFAGGFSAADSTRFIKSYWDVTLNDLPGIGLDAVNYDNHIPDTHILELMGLTTTEFMAQASFVDWDFTGSWMIKEGSSRPYNALMKALFVGAPPVMDYQNVTASATVTNVGTANLVAAGFVFRSGDLSWSEMVPDAAFAALATDASGAINVQYDDMLKAGEVYSVQAYATDADGINHYGDASLIMFEEEAYDATVEVRDELDAVVAGASVTLQGYGTLVTDASGLAVFTDVIADKRTPIIIENAGYPKYISSLMISSNESMTYNLTTSTHTVTFMVTDSAAVANALAGVSVEILGGATVVTDGTGTAVFAGVADANNVMYEASLADWVTVDGLIDLSADMQEDVVMEPRSMYIEVLDNNGDAIAGAAVTLGAYGTLVTDAMGMAAFMPVTPAADVALEIVADSFNIHSELIEIMNETATQTITMERTMLRFIVRDADDAFMSYVDVILAEDTLVTGEWGHVSFYGVPSGVDQAYKLEKFGYADVTGTANLANENDTLWLAMDRNLFNMTFVVTDMADAIIVGAEVQIPGIDTIVTDAEGKALFENVPIGDHPYTVVNGLTHEAVTGTLAVTDNDGTETVKMTTLLYTVTINVTDASSNPLEGANVTLTGYGIQASDASGDAVFADVAPGDNKVYSVSLAGYEDAIDVLNVVDADVNLTVELVAKPYSVTIEVLDENSAAIEGATVTLTGLDAQTTDASGKTVFSDLLGSFAVEVSKEGYDTANDNVSYDDKDGTVTVTLIKAVGVEFINAAAFELYPNPSTDYVNVKLQVNNGRIAVYNVIGKTIMVKEIDSDNMKIDFTDQESGIYLMKIWNEKGSQIGTARLIIQK